MAHCSSAEHHQQPFRLRLLGSGAPSFLGRGMFDERRCGSSSREAAAGRWGQGRRQRLAAKAVLSERDGDKSPHRLLATIAPAGLPEAAPSDRPPLARCGNARAVDGSWCRPGRSSASWREEVATPAHVPTRHDLGVIINTAAALPTHLFSHHLQLQPFPPVAFSGNKAPNMIADTVQHAAVKEGRKLASKHPLQRLDSPSRGASALLHVRCRRHQSPSASFDQRLIDSSSVAAASHTPFISMLPIYFVWAFNNSSSLPEARGKARPEYLGTILQLFRAPGKEES